MRFNLTNYNLIVLLLSIISIILHFLFNSADLPLIIIIIFAGIPLVAQIIFNLLKLDLGADLLAAIALVTSVLLNQYLAAVLLIIMLAGGQVLEAFAIRKASSVLLALSNRMPSIAHKKVSNHIEEIAITDIAINDHIIVFPHETVPVDGIVIEGNGSMDESYLTGEPYKVSKAPGANVLSGAINGDAVITIRAIKLAADSRYAQIMQVMQEAEQKRPVLRRIGDQLGAVFAPLALFIAFFAWYISGDVLRFLAVLVVATPCPLLIAIPITLISAISLAARNSIVIKDPTVLERLPTCRTTIFDKTGTLTYGIPELTEIILIDNSIARDDILQLAASLERYSKHPLAAAILTAAQKNKLIILEASNVAEKPGEGLQGIVNNQHVTITSRKNLINLNLDNIKNLSNNILGLECIILINHKYAATFRFRDTPRVDGKSFISHLAPAHKFNKIILISGDRKEEVAYLAHLLGITESYSAQSPEQKLAMVQTETALAPTLFMGDGINDAPALAVATVGIAFGQHSSVTAEAAGAVIMDNTLAKVDELIHISMAMRKIILQSAVGGMIFSIIAMGFAAAGFITPVYGALLQELIDIVAIINALRLSLSKNIKADMQLEK